MKKSALNAKIAETKGATQSALQTMYDALNSGQKKKIVKVAEVAALFERYEVNV